jgi:hypothetical protein
LVTLIENPTLYFVIFVVRDLRGAKARQAFRRCHARRAGMSADPERIKCLRTAQGPPIRARAMSIGRSAEDGQVGMSPRLLKRQPNGATPVTGS